MHIYFEPIERPASFTDCKINYLSWMGRVSETFLQSWNDDQQQEDNWKFNHIKYYEEGWLSSGNQRGIVGVTYTSCKCPSKLNKINMPSRTNYNLRGHRTEIKFVKWNEPFQKLATVDSNGTIFVWVKDSRWSIELINDREVQVVDFNWSHDGRMALISYLDGFILIGSVAGQRYYSSIINLESNQMTTGIWSADDRQVIIGVSNGSFLVLNLSGTILAEFMLRENVSVYRMAWSCEKFKLDEDQDLQNDILNDNFNLNQQQQQHQQQDYYRVNSPIVGRPFDEMTTTNNSNKDESLNNCFKNNYKNHILAICFEDGYIYLLRSGYDDPFPVKLNTKLLGIQLEWSNKGEILAVGGHLLNMSNLNFIHKPQQQPYYMNVIKFYASANGHLRYVVNLNYTFSPITALTWGHNDRRLFVATGNCIHVAWISKAMPKLQLLSRLAIKQFINKESDVKLLQLPVSLRILLRSLFIRTLRCYLPDLNNLREFCTNPPPNNLRYYCTLIRHCPKDRDARSKLFSTYVLYLEYLGGLIPILKGKRTSKLKPEFIIYDPQPINTSTNNNQKDIFVFNENTFNKFENRRSSTRRIAYFVPNNQFNNQTTKSSKLNSFLNNKNSSNGSNSESEDELNSLNNQQSNCAIETLPSTVYQSFIKRKLYRNKSNRQTSTQRDESSSLINNQINNQTNNQTNNNVDENELNNQLNHLNQLNQLNNNEEIENPLVLTLLGNNPIIFTRRRVINSNAINLDKKLSYVDEMPENKKFLLITSNIFGTRFKFLSLTNWLPTSLGSISYKTSLLHLQPRQMRIQIKELLFNSNNLASALNDNGHNNGIQNNSLQNRITENILKSCESDYNFNNVDEDYEWSNTSFEDDEYLKTIPVVAPLSPQFLNNNRNLNNNSKMGNDSMEFQSMEDYLTFQIDPSTDKINCNLTFPSNQRTNQNYLSLNEFCQRQSRQQQHFKEEFLRPCTQQKTITNSVSTQTSFPSLNNLEEEEDCENLIDDGEDTLHTLASCSRLIHSSSMIVPGRNANQSYKNELIDRTGEFKKLLINRNSLDLSLQRRLILKNNKRPLSSYSLKLDNRTKCILNCMYLDNEEDDLLIEENKNNYENNNNNFNDINDESMFNDDLEFNDNKKDNSEFDIHNLQLINKIQSSNESLLESYCFDDHFNQSLIKENSDLNNKLEFTNCSRFIPPSTPVHKRKQLNEINNLTDKMKDLNNNRQKLIKQPKFCSRESFDKDDSEFDDIQIITEEDNHSRRTRLCNSTSDLLIERSEYCEERRKSELKDRLSIRSDNCEFNSTDLLNRSMNRTNNFMNHSLPTTPTLNSKKTRKRSFGKTLLYSPIMIRKAMKQKFNYLDCSSDDDRSSDNDAPYGQTTIKTKQSVKQSFCISKRHSLNKVQPNDDRTQPSLNTSFRELIMYNKPPVWNSLSAIFQLDFSGRVTQESAKNFQIEFDDKQVLQFGRIDKNAYTLDFQQPFCALQALSVALANVTQRLK